MQKSEPIPNSGAVRRLNACSIATFKKPPQTFVFKGFDHY